MPRDSRVQQLLSSAGWSPGRDASISLDKWLRVLQREGFEPTAPATALLRELGGLRVVQSGPGETVARSTFSFDPLSAVGERDNFRRYEGRLGSSLFPIGDASDGTAFLAVTETGTVVLLLDDMWIIGADTEEALESLVYGRRGVLVPELPVNHQRT